MRVQQLHCVVSGRVQGVAFRNFVKEIAIEMELHGFVANLPDGSLEVLVQGKYEVLKVFLGHLARGPRGALVTGLYDEWESEPERVYEDFQILQ